MKRRIELALTVLALGGVACGVYLYASDHDDGENDRKSRALNLTDLACVDGDCLHPQKRRDRLDGTELPASRGHIRVANGSRPEGGRN